MRINSGTEYAVLSRNKEGRGGLSLAKSPSDPLSSPCKGTGDMLHFQLLSDRELEALRPLLKNLGEQSDRIVEDWYRRYATHFGEVRELSEAEFSDLFSPFLRCGKLALSEHNSQQYATCARDLGERLALRGIPFIEVILSLHLYEEGVSAVYREELTSALEPSFAKLSHIRTALVAEGYVRTEEASSSFRVESKSDVNRPELDNRTSFHGLLGGSPAMRHIYDRVEAAARARGTVLIVGESGTGKELVARAIHSMGSNSDAPFVAVNCPAIPRDLIESELFGHKRGSFSGANVDYIGLFRAAEGGALLLDEVTEMNLETQSKLLRVLQERSVRPVGSAAELAVNVRVIASTNRRPEEAVRMGLLREDLYYRLQSHVIEIPPLRERSEDIPLLTSHFIRRFNADTAPVVPVIGIAEDAMAALLRYSWPGNVRELSNAIESAITFGGTSRIRLGDLPQNIRQNATGVALLPVIRTADAEMQLAPVRQLARSSPQTFDEIERELIERTLQIAVHNKTYAAELLHISRKKLYARSAKYGLLNEGRRARRDTCLSEAPLVCSP
jgi:DNA-binding NtrC family response regulator